jgi:DNA-binding MarR family transcriptional regulator
MKDFGEEINSSFRSEKVKAMLNVKFTAAFLNTKQSAFFGQYDLSPQQYNILRILRGGKEPLKVQTIKERMIERAPNATRLMDKLKAKGLLERIACESDRRVVHIAITNQGLELLAQIDQTLPEDFIPGVTVEEAKVLNRLLDKMRAEFKAD